MPSITLEWDSRDVAVWRGGRFETALVTALKKAGGDAIRALRAESKRQVRNRTKIRAGYLAEKALPLRFPKGKRISDLIWVMDVSGRAVPLGEFPRRQTRQGVRVEVVKGQAKLIKSAFLAIRDSGRKGVFLRPGKERYPMGHRLGLNVADSMSDGQIPSASLNFAERKFAQSFDRLLPLELERLRR